jgi:hypothetical protein
VYLCWGGFGHPQQDDIGGEAELEHGHRGAPTTRSTVAMVVSDSESYLMIVEAEAQTVTTLVREFAFTAKCQKSRLGPIPGNLRNHLQLDPNWLKRKSLQ